MFSLKDVSFTWESLRKVCPFGVLTWWWAQRCRGERSRCQVWRSHSCSGAGWFSATYRSCLTTSLHGGWSLTLAGGETREETWTQAQIGKNWLANWITTDCEQQFHDFATILPTLFDYSNVNNEEITTIRRGANNAILTQPRSSCIAVF